ncbi:MAG: GNAT family N-acetyltransferase [Solobacterium sp.]|nr:GNAT family N-acetyltransferase [Solobacterium sp.]
MLIRKASGHELLALWGCRDADTAPPTARFFFNNICEGNAVFWTLDNDGELCGELYAFLNLGDKDFADGRNTAYLCAFRVKKECRGQGYGTGLINAALEDLKQMGFRSAAIGVGIDEPQNIRLYSRLGFSTRIKDCHYDPCGMDENMQPVYEETAWWLLKKDL